MEFLSQSEVFYKKAKVDLKAAKILLSSFESGEVELDMEVILFHLQQAAEKIFKAFLAKSGIHITKTHDLEFLLNKLQENGIEFFEEVNELVELSDYAVEGRYSIICDDLEDIEKYILIIERLFLMYENLKEVDESVNK